MQIANLQQELRERIEAARAPPPSDAMRAQAHQEIAPPLLDPTSDELLVLEFTDTNLSAIRVLSGRRRRRQRHLRRGL